jgi:large repetitive protein
VANFSPRRVRHTALLLAVLVAVALVGPPTAAQAAAGTINTTAQGLRVSVTLLGGITLPINTPQATWQTGQAANTRSTGSAGAGSNVLGAGAITATAAPVTGGGTADSEVPGLNVLGASTVGADAISTTCTMNAA